MAAALLQEISQDERERARLRSRKMYEMDMTSDLLTAEAKGELRERDKWQGIVAGVKAENANKDTEINQLRLRIAELEAKN